MTFVTYGVAQGKKPYQACLVIADDTQWHNLATLKPSTAQVGCQIYCSKFTTQLKDFFQVYGCARQYILYIVKTPMIPAGLGEGVSCPNIK